MKRKEKIYEALKNASDGIGNRQLSRLTNMPSSTIQYNLQKLVKERKVVQDPITKKYFTRKNYIRYKVDNVERLLHSIFQDINDAQGDIPRYIVFTGDDFELHTDMPSDYRSIFTYYADKILAEDEDVIRLLGYILLIGFNKNPYLKDLDYEITSTEQLREYLDKHDFDSRLKFICNSLTDGLEKAILYYKEAVLDVIRRSLRKEGVELPDEDYVDVIDRYDLVHDLQWLKIFYNPYMYNSLLVFLHHFIYKYDVAYDDLRKSLMEVMKNRDKLYDFFSKLSSIKFLLIIPFNINKAHTSPSSIV